MDVQEKSIYLTADEWKGSVAVRPQGSKAPVLLAFLKGQ